MIFFTSFLKKYLGRITDPIKNPANPIINVTVKLMDGLLSDSSRNTENNKRTIRGLKI